MERLAVLTSGGDCSGMNATLRAVVRAGIARGLDVVGIQKGYRGLIDRQYEIMTTRSVSGIIQRGGTVLQSARCKEMLEEAGQKLAVENLRGLGVDGVIVIGGDGSLRGAQVLYEHGINTIGIPASIDNDIPYTDVSLGVDTALNNILHAVDTLKDTASSHDRTFVVETMGRNCGYLAVASAIACGAEYAIIPEEPYDIVEICRNLEQRYREGRDNSIIMVAEGAAHAQDIADSIKECVSSFETRIMVLGHYQRGGSPTSFDRLLGGRMGVTAVDALREGRGGEMLGLSCAELKLTPLDKVLTSDMRPIDPKLLLLADILGL